MIALLKEGCGEFKTAACSVHKVQEQGLGVIFYHAIAVFEAMMWKLR